MKIPTSSTRKKIYTRSKESQKRIKQGQEDTLFFQLQEVNRPTKELKREEFKSMIKEIKYSSDDSSINLPPISFQTDKEIEKMNLLFSQEIQQQEEELKSLPEKPGPTNEDGQRILIIGSSQKPMNIIRR